MSEEPRHGHYGVPMSEQIARAAIELPIDAVHDAADDAQTHYAFGGLQRGFTGLAAAGVPGCHCSGL